MLDRIKKEQEIKTLKEAKSIILRLKGIFEELNLSESEIKHLFQECGLNFGETEKSGMEKLGIKECFVPGEPINISDESIVALRLQMDENVR